MSKKTVVVFAARSPIGQSIVQSLTQKSDDAFDVVAAVRCPLSDTSCRHLQTTGARLVQVDPTDPESLAALLTDVWAVFIHLPVTLSEANCLERAIEAGTKIIHACKVAKVCHVVYSTAQSPMETLGVAARHYDAWAQVEKVVRHSRLNVTYLMIPVPFELLLTVLKPKKFARGRYALDIPTANVAIDFMSAADVGPVVKEILSHPEQYVQKTVALSSGKLSTRAISEVLTKVLAPLDFVDGKTTHEVFRSRNMPGSVDLANMFDFLIRVDQQYSPETTVRLNPKVASFKEWLCKNKSTLLEVLEK